MKTIMAIFLLLPSLGLAQTSNTICIGERCSGQKISVGYIEDNPVLRTEPGSIVKSYRLSYSLNNAMYDVNQTGNQLISLIPKLRLIPVDKKIYVEATVGLPSGKTEKRSAIFTMEDYTFTDKIYLGNFFNGDSISFHNGVIGDLHYENTDYEIVNYIMSYTDGHSLVQKNVNGYSLPHDIELYNIRRHSKIYFEKIYVRHKTNKEDAFTCKAIFIVK